MAGGAGDPSARGLQHPAWDGRYKYITGFEKGEDLVFDLTEDPLEDRNLGAGAPPAALQMRDVLRQEREKVLRASA